MCDSVNHTRFPKGDHHSVNHTRFLKEDHQPNWARRDNKVMKGDRAEAHVDMENRILISPWSSL